MSSGENRKPVSLKIPLDEQIILSLRAGQKVLLSGVIYTARDAAHKRIVDAIESGDDPPFNLHGQVIYYVGPAPARPGQVIGPAGPTTSYRMDPYTLLLLQHGLKGMIGKGPRSPEVLSAIQQYKAVYFAGIGGIAALVSRCIVSAEVVAYEDLGTEAVRRLEVRDMPLYVAADAYGGNLYAEVMSSAKR